MRVRFGLRRLVFRSGLGTGVRRGSRLYWTAQSSAGNGCSAMKRYALVLALAFMLSPLVAHALPHYSQAYTRAAIRTEARRAHYGPVNTAALLDLAHHESRWHNWSSNHGHYLGVFQLHNTMCAGHPWWSPQWSTRRAIVYIRNRYGSPARALRFYHIHCYY